MLDHGCEENKSGEDLEFMANSLIGKFSISYLINPSKRYEDVYEMYKKAAIAYKIENKWEKAGDTYLKAAEYINNNQNDGLFLVSTPFETTECVINAINCYDKTKHPNRITCRLTAINLYKKSDSFERCGKLHMEIAVIYENEFKIEKAIEHYAQAHKSYELDGKRKTDAVACLDKYAELYLQLENPDMVNLLEIYNKIIDHYQSSKLGKFKLNLYIMMAMFTVMAMNYQPIDYIESKYDNYSNLDYLFDSSKEGMFVCDIISTIKNNDVELFENKCFEFNKNKPLDRSMVKLLTIIKKRINNYNYLTEEEMDDEETIDLC